MPVLPRQFNVFSPVVVVYQNETFQWIVTAQELGSSSSIVVQPSGGAWPLDKPSYTVTAAAPVTAKVTGTAGAGFTCNPPPTNVTAQKIVTTPRAAGSACNATTVAPGDYLIWLNDSTDTLFIAPDPGNANYWPLPQPQYAVPPNSWIAVAVPSEAANGSYPITVNDKLGQPQCLTHAQPIIIVQSNGASGHKGHKR
jgi:hypothetical protein